MVGEDGGEAGEEVAREADDGEVRHIRRLFHHGGCCFQL